MDESATPLEIRFDANISLTPWEVEEQYVHEIVGEVVGTDDDHEEFSLGIITLLKIGLSEAYLSGEARVLIWSGRTVWDGRA